MCLLDRVLGIVNLINEKQYLKELTLNRCLASVPFGGRNRLIDFTLSNFIHANISKVGIFAKENYRSMMDHLGTGKEWDLDRRNGGLFFFPPMHPNKMIRGDLDQFKDQIDFFHRSAADLVVISPGHHVCKIDFTDVIKEHKKSKADITLVYKAYEGEPVSKPLYHTCKIDEAGEVQDIGLYTRIDEGDLVCLETYVINKEVLIDIIESCVNNKEYDLLKDGIKANLTKRRVNGYAFEGVLPFIHSLRTYHTSNMTMLDPHVLQSFFFRDWDIFTKVKHEPPAKYSAFSKVNKSLIANGCDIEGIVENSIIFRGVKIRKGAVVKNCIIMQKGEIEEGALLENVITDKQVKVRKNQVVMGDLDPMVIKKGEII